jgi:hypothetical protein
VATRFYLPSAGAAAIAPAFGAGWTVTTSADRLLMVTAKTGSAKVLLRRTNGVATTVNRLIRQYISAPIAGGPITGDLWGVTRGNQDNGANNASAQLRVAVYSGDGTTLRGVLLDVDNVSSSSPEFDSQASFAASRRSFPRQVTYPGNPVLPVVASPGDVIVAELGYRAIATSAARWGELLFGDNSGAGNDLAASTGSGGSLYDPWLEFEDELFTDRGGGLEGPTLTQFQRIGRGRGLRRSF